MPKIGDRVYIPTHLYIGHGEDDFQGGLCTIIGVDARISGGEPAPFIKVKEDPSTWYNWLFLEKRQDELKAEFGNKRGYSDPDYSKSIA